MKIIIQGNVVEICAHCGRYFIPDGGSDMEYCPQPLADQPEKTCQDIGEMVRMQNKIRNDPIFREYSKAYKRNNSRVRMGKMSQSEFLQWSMKQE